MSGRKMWCGMRPARRPFSYPLPTRASRHPLVPFQLPPPSPPRLLPNLVSFAEKIVFISTVVRTDSVAVIYVPAQTHLIYSAEHNSLTLFWGKTVVYLGYATKSRKLQHKLPLPLSFLDILHFAFSFPPFSFRLPIISTIASRTPFFPNALLSLSLSLFARRHKYSFHFVFLARSNDTRCVTFMNRFSRLYLPSSSFFFLPR